MISLSQTQKKVIEWPLIVALVFFIQALEISVLRLPLWIGPIHPMPILIVYLSVTRNWGPLVILTSVFAFMGSATVGYPWPVYLAVHLWTALVLKLVILTFALEGRRAFIGLAALGNVLSKILVYVIQGSLFKTLPLPLFLRDLVATTLVATVLAWILFPAFAAWDAYFEHELEEARELRPGALR